MTTIAANKNEMACDLQFTYGDMKFKGGTKIVMLEGPASEALLGAKKTIIGFCGNADTWGNVLPWLLQPTPEIPKCKGIEFLALTDKKKIYHSTNLRNWMEIPQKHFAIGSGMQYAMAAMSAGKSPKDAVVIASKHDTKTGLGVKSYKISSK